MVDDTTDLDGHRGMSAQKATMLRRQDLDVEKDRQAVRAHAEEVEKTLVSEPSRTWSEAADKARYLLLQFGQGVAASDTRKQRMIAMVLADFDRLQGEDARR